MRLFLSSSSGGYIYFLIYFKFEMIVDSAQRLPTTQNRLTKRHFFIDLSF